MDPVTLSAIATIGGSILDGLFGNKQRKDSPKLAGKTAFLENQQGLLGRVDAAKSLGLHPLAALGANISGSGAPMPVGTDFAGAFESVGNAYLQRKQLDQQKRAQDAESEIRKAEETRRAAETAADVGLKGAQQRYYDTMTSDIERQARNSEAALIRSQSQVSPLNTEFGDMQEALGKLIKYLPNEVVRSNSKGETYGAHPSLERSKTPAGDVVQPYGYSSQGEPTFIWQAGRELEAMTGIPIIKYWQNVFRGKHGLFPGARWPTSNKWAPSRPGHE